MTNEQPQEGVSKAGLIMRYIFLGLLLVTWVFWKVAVFHCTFMKVGPDSSFYAVDYKDQPAFGLFSFPAYKDDPDSRIYSCRSYHPDEIDEFDGAFIAARLFGALGYIVHSLAFFIAVATVLFVRAKVPLIWLIVRILVIVSLVCSLLIFSAYGECSEGTKCVPGAGGILAIFNIVFIIAALVLSWLVAPPQNPLFLIRLWQEGDSSLANPTPAPVTGQVVEKEGSKAEPTQNMNEEYNNEQATPVEPPTMSYIQAETANNREIDAMEAEA